jgi:hypothetical protein
MASSAYLRRQAALCLRIAAAVYDPNVAAAFVAMADDLGVKADEIDPNPGSGGQAARGGCNAGRISR